MKRIVLILGMFALSFTFLAPPHLLAQDTRVVTEPVIPPSCVTLDAQLTRVGKSLDAADEHKLDTDRIQKALDTCGKGKGVELRSKGALNAFLTGPLVLRDGVTLVIDKGVVLFASLDADVFAVAPGSCGKLATFGPRPAAAPVVTGTPAAPVPPNPVAAAGELPPSPMGRGRMASCKPMISAENISGAGIMGDGVIDARGGMKYLGKDVSAWDIAEQARSGGVQLVSRILVANHADNFTLYNITMKNSPNFHVSYNAGDGFTVWGMKIDTPQRLARNTDGIDPGNGSKNITITHSYLREGDDNVAIKGGGAGLTNMTVSHNHFYWGHGMSIGSETDGGVSKIRVFDLTLDGPDNAIRIKSNGSRGGLTHDVIYDDICIRNSPNPITLDTAYSAAGTLTGNKLPVMQDITLHNVRISGGGKFSFNGYDTTHRVAAKLDNVLITDAASGAKYTYSLHHSDVTIGPGPSNLQLAPNSTDDFTLTGKPSEGKAESCEGKFVPFPVIY
jgi:polygalacturonase